MLVVPPYSRRDDREIDNVKSVLRVPQGPNLMSQDKSPCNAIQTKT